MDSDRNRLNWRTPVIHAILVCLGSILILFPAWLPSTTKKGVDLENSAVELLQVVLLLFSMALLLAASIHAKGLKPIYQALALGCLAACIGESPWVDDITRIDEKWFLAAIFITFGILIFRNTKQALLFISLSGRHPASGFIASAIILTYIFAKFFGSHAFWAASLEGEVPARLPKLCSAYLELLACYFIFVGVVGFTLPLNKYRASA